MQPNVRTHPRLRIPQEQCPSRISRPIHKTLVLSSLLNYCKHCRPRSRKLKLHRSVRPHPAGGSIGLRNLKDSEPARKDQSLSRPASMKVPQRVQSKPTGDTVISLKDEIPFVLPRTTESLRIASRSETLVRWDCSSRLGSIALESRALTLILFAVSIE